MIKEILVRCTEKQKKTGEKFPVYKARKADGTWQAMKFKRDASVPVRAGMYVMSIESAHINKSITDYGTVWWVQEVEEYRQYVAPDEAADEF